MNFLAPPPSLHQKKKKSINVIELKVPFYQNYNYNN